MSAGRALAGAHIATDAVTVTATDAPPAGAGPAYTFVLGTGRCGSTLVHEVLARHPEVGFLSNLEDRAPLPASAGRWNSTLYRRLPPSVTQKGRLRYAPSEGYRALDRAVSPLLSSPTRDLVAADATPWLQQRLRRFFDERAAAQGRPAFLHKLTGWPRAGLLAEVFPGARFVHVVRDGRAVANSWLQMPWWEGHRGPEGWHFGPLPPAYGAEWEGSGRDFTLLAGLAWKVLIDAFEEARAGVRSDRWLDVRFEDVVAEPAATFVRIADFAGLAPDPRFDGGVARHPFSTGRTAAFRRDLAPAQVDALSRSLAGHLRRWGYDPA